MTRVLVIDNYDSFVYTLAGYLQQLGAEVDVVRNDDFSVDAAADAIAPYDAVLLSPGPGKPADAGVSIAVVRAAAAARTPLLGVCLGHQAIAESFGGVVTNAEELMHGKTSRIVHDGGAFYAGVPQPFTATRYHSLAVVDGTVPEQLVVTSRTVTGPNEATAREDGDLGTGVIMGLQHRELPIFGVQFHPESVLTEGGYLMLGNWLAVAGMPEAAITARGLNPLVSAS